MKAFQVSKYAHPTQVAPVSDAPEPKLKENDVLVDVYSVGLNFFDILQCQGKYQTQPPMPFILGTEFAGKISANSPIPKGSNLKTGDRVFGATQGTFAERVNVDIRSVFPIPDGMDYDQAAGLYITWPTSYEALTGRGQTKPGDWVLVHAGAGGVGIAAVQIAKVLGAKVIATAGSPEKLEICRTRGGADFALDYRQAGWQKEVMKITGGHGADVVYDPVGLIRDSLKCIAWKGRALVIGFAAGNIEKIPMNLVLLKNISLVGLFWGEYRYKDYERIPEVWKELYEIWGSKKGDPVVYDKVFKGLEGISEGLKALEDRETWGKAVVRLREEEVSARL